MIVVGIDTSLAATGMARVDTADRLYVDVRIIASTGTENDTLTQRRDRLSHLVNRGINDVVLGLPYGDGLVADLVVIETPALSKANIGTSMLNGLYWMLVDRLHVLRIPVAAVGIGQLKKYATGAGNASKGAVIDATARRLPHVETRGNDNLCDATWLAAMGARHLGQPIDDVPKVNLEAMVKVPWPEGAVL